MAEITITADVSTALRRLGATRTAVTDAATIHKVAANAVAIHIRNWLIARNAKRSRHARSNYWAHAAESVHHISDSQSATVKISHDGVVWHLYGGTIQAKPGKAFAIPMRDSEYGVWPSERFPDRADAFIYRRRGRAYLAARDGRALRIYYLLLKSVSKRADPTVLPNRNALASTVQDSISALLARVISVNSHLLD